MPEMSSARKWKKLNEKLKHTQTQPSCAVNGGFGKSTHLSLRTYRAKINRLIIDSYSALCESALTSLFPAQGRVGGFSAKKCSSRKKLKVGPVDVTKGPLKEISGQALSSAPFFLVPFWTNVRSDKASILAGGCKHRLKMLSSFSGHLQIFFHIVAVLQSRVIN